MEEKSLNISEDMYDFLKRSRVLSIRGKGQMIKREKIECFLKELKSIKTWMEDLLKEV